MITIGGTSNKNALEQALVNKEEEFPRRKVNFMTNNGNEEIPRFTHTSIGADKKMRSRSFRTIDLKKRTEE